MASEWISAVGLSRLGKGATINAPSRTSLISRGGRTDQPQRGGAAFGGLPIDPQTLGRGKDHPGPQGRLDPGGGRPGAGRRPDARAWLLARGPEGGGARGAARLRL